MQGGASYHRFFRTRSLDAIVANTLFFVAPLDFVALDAYTAVPSVDLNEPQPASKRTPGGETIDEENTDEEKVSKPAEGTEADNSAVKPMKRDEPDGKGISRTMQVSTLTHINNFRQISL